MMCPVCGKWTQVRETRKRPDNIKWRRYSCGNEHTFVTEERVTRIIKPRKSKREGG